MKRNKCIRNHISIYYPYYIITLLFLWIWYLCFPFLPGPDPYGSATNQWGIGAYILFHSIYKPLEYIMQSKEGEFLSDFCYSLMDTDLIKNGTRTFVYHLGAGIVTLFHSFLLYYCILLMVNPLKTKGKNSASILVCIFLFILTVGFLMFVKNIDLLFCSTSLLSITIVTRKFVLGKKIRTGTFILLLIISTISVSYRKNSILILPILIWMYLKIYHYGHNLKTIHYSFVSIAISLIIAIPISTSLLIPILHIEDSHGEEVFMSSDYACMRMLKGKNIELDNLAGIKQDSVFLFMQNYERFGTCNDMREKWIKEIKDSPKVFFYVRGINYLQFLTLGCMPEYVINILKTHYPHVYFPNEKDFCTMVDFINNPKQRFEGDKHIHQLSEFGDNFILLKRSLLNYDLYINWLYLSRILLVVYIISILCFIYNLYFRFNNSSIKTTNQLAIWFGLLEFSYLLSFAVFTPTPDYRYHLFSLLMAYLSIGMTFCKDLETKNKTSSY